MNTLLLALLMFAGLALPLGAEPAAAAAIPAISLFESVERVRAFLKTEAKLDYADKYLSGITLHYIDAHPQKGFAWLYSFAFNTPRLGGSISIYHYMDGEIIESHQGP